MRLLIFMLFLVFVSCNKNVKSNDFFRDFEDNRWPFNQDVEFDFTIDQGEELWLHFGHIYDYDYDMIPIEMEITKTEGDLNKMFVIEKLKVKNVNGGDSGECLGDICDYYQKVNLKDLEPGKYHIVLRNKSDLPYLPNVLGIGYQIRKPNQ
ncbi:DUF5625 family protein [Flavobacterium okayamense]|uniref:Gliding motility-associated lipoprotein GldH n=1 Tax=Flavobacterium okayamense TaxID=2830782 RepID=A0ABM7S595_9FLAO|nr:hypothetical protein [Flavobacterium okayamense]BCY28731.1 hypothetical protein KK2020170_15990 [Flavobacterium okayamense]